MKGNHDLERWLGARHAALRAAGVAAETGRAALIPGSPTATWISFETARARGRATLWSSGRCQLDATIGAARSTTEPEIASPAALDAALDGFIDRLTLTTSG